MKKIIFFSAIFFFLASSFTFAQTQNVPLANVSGYVIDDFHSEIQVSQDTSLTVTETIKVNYLQAKHGIFRIIPVIYSANGQTIRAGLKDLSITDANGQAYQYETSGYNQSIKIKIGDPNRTLTGKQTYVIRYTINKVLLRYPGHDEIYLITIPYRQFES